MANDPHGLDWSQIQTVVYGLWDYIITGMRYRTATFDVLDVEADAQIGWGHIAEQASNSLPTDTVRKRNLQLLSPTLPPSPSSEDSTSIQPNSNITTPPLTVPIYWPIADSNFALQFTYPGNQGHAARKEPLDPDAVRHVLLVAVEMCKDAIRTKGEDALLGGPGFGYIRDGVSLRVVNWPRMVTWGQLAETVVGLIDYIVDHDNYYCYHFSLYTQRPKREIGIGSLLKANTFDSNVTVARRGSVDGEKGEVGVWREE